METGRKIAQKAVARMAKFQLEMGGKNPLVVLDDADLKTAVESAVNGAFFSTGQRCTASSRLIVTKGIHNKFVDALTERLKGLVVDNALKAGTQIGPVVDKNQLNQDLFYIEEGKKEGAKLAYGGNLLKREKEGFYLEPALFTETSNSMRINREEVFGPVATVLAAKDYDEALQLANDTPFGLSAGIVTGFAQARGALPPQQPGRHGDGEPAHRGRGLPRAVRRAQGLELRPARAGALRRGVLHHGEDRVRGGTGLGREAGPVRSAGDDTTGVTEGLYLLGAVALVLVNGFFVAAEFALVKLRQTRVKGIERRFGLRGRLLGRVHANLDAYLSACQLGITLASIGLGWIGEPAIARLLQPVLAR